MTAAALTAALEGLVDWPTVYSGNLSSENPEYPYVLVTAGFPQASERSHARTVQAREARIRTTIAGFTQDSILQVAGAVVDSLEGARPVVPGWSVGRIEGVPNGQPIQTDDDVVVPNFGHPMYLVLDWVATASQLPG
ncbi:hypothetical protein PTW37_10220 [Arthrobacter agilis]|uniref:hypothetical protein n=1 Tax=Arthrobacter agilis TaxID=37921 RepID=UPI00236603AB|nr:hypothetical protein [Arthrobacter agilis]WDF32249.1 hypothetical protein PTW37_10220 [Arthrobacter agilis]